MLLEEAQILDLVVIFQFTDILINKKLIINLNVLQTQRKFILKLWTKPYFCYFKKENFKEKIIRKYQDKFSYNE